MDQQLDALSVRIQQGRTRKSNLVHQVVEAFRHLITHGQLPLGTKFENEYELARRLDISRPTLREAVKVLIHDGLLVSRRGIGTFVVDRLPHKVRSGLERMTSTTDLIRATGRTPGTRDFSWKVIPAPAEVAASLDSPAGSEVVAIDRIRLIDEMPLMWTQEYLPLRYLSAVDQMAGFDGLSLYEFLRNELGLHLSHCESSITAWAADRPLADKLEILVGDALLMLAQTHYERDGTPALRSINYHNSNLMEFHLVRTEIGAS